MLREPIRLNTYCNTYSRYQLNNKGKHVRCTTTEKYNTFKTLMQCS